jgi:hypothetical protein
MCDAIEKEDGIQGTVQSIRKDATDSGPKLQSCDKYFDVTYRHGQSERAH